MIENFHTVAVVQTNCQQQQSLHWTPLCHVFRINVTSDTMDGTSVLTGPVVVPNLTILPYETKKLSLFTFITSIPRVTLLCNSSICGGNGVTASNPDMTGVSLAQVDVPFKLAALGPQVFSMFLTDSLVTSEFIIDIKSSIRISALVVRPAISYNLRAVLASLI